MSNLKISQLTATTTNNIDSWLIVNNSGETVTNKSQLKYVMGLTQGTGSSSIKSADFLTTTGATSGGDGSIALGDGANSGADHAVAIGQQTLGVGPRDVVIGLRARNELNDPGSSDVIAIGTDARVTRSYGIAIGYDAQALTDGVAIGRSTRPIGDQTICIGKENVAAGNGGFSIGKTIFTDRNNSGAIGADLYVDGEDSIALGSNNDIGRSGGQCDKSVSIGYNNEILGGAPNQINIGSNITSRSQGSIVISNQTVDLGSSSNNAIFISATGNTVTTKVGGESVVIGGRNTMNNPGDYALVLGGTGSTISSSGLSNAMIQSNNSNINGNVRRSTLLGSINSRISGSTGTQLASMLGSDSGVIYDSGKSSIFNGLSNTIQNCGTSTIICSDDSFLSGGTYFTIIGSEDSRIETSTSSDERNSIIGALSGTILNTDSSFIVGGNRNTISGGSLGQILGGNQNTITGTTFNAEIIASDSCTISDGDYNTILGSIGSTIQNTSSERNIMIGGSGNTISANANQIHLGLLGRTTSESDFTYAEGIRAFGQIYNGYYDNGSGSTFTIDWSLGNSQKITITGNAALTFTNVKSGGQYRLQVVNGGTHDITGVTASGFTILCEGGAIPNITNNGVDLCILEGMGTDLLVRHFSNFATP